MTEPTSPDVTELLPCPFCGRHDLDYREDESEDEPHHNYIYAWHVFCRDCHCHGRNNFPIGWCESKRAAAEAWNRRAPDLALRQEVERLTRDLRLIRAQQKDDFVRAEAAEAALRLSAQGREEVVEECAKAADRAANMLGADDFGERARGAAAAAEVIRALALQPKGN